jgi:hypothetical protein
MEVASVEEAMRGNPAQEQLRAHVLPAAPRLQSLLGAFDLLRDQMTHDGLLESMSTMQVGDPVPLHDAYGLSVQPMTVTFVGSEQGISTLTLFAEIAGDLTVADTLSSEEIDALLAATEAENPAAVTAVERFLSLNLLTYARTAQRSEDDLAKSFASPSFLSQLRTILERSRLSAARYLLGGAFGAKLEEHRLWPLQFLTVERSALDDLGGGRFRLALEMSAYLREGE